MKKRTYYILASIIILLGVGVWIFTINSAKTSLDEVVWKKINKDNISSINIIKEHEEGKVLTLTDKDEIDKVINSLSDIEMKQTSSSNRGYNEFYTIIVKVDNTRTFGMTLYDTKYIDVHDYEAYPTKKNKSLSYEISNDFDLKVIRDIFK
ncbi:DUF5301 domain-containing protein [Paenibacillus sp. S33]